jgi:hypothetical protein
MLSMIVLIFGRLSGGPETASQPIEAEKARVT